MRKGYGAEGLALIEMAYGETCHLRMHTAMTVENAHELGTTLTVLPSQQSLEEGVTAVVKADVAQVRLVDSRQLRALLHYCRQLLMVAY